MTGFGAVLVTIAITAAASPDSARPISLAEVVALAQRNAPAVIQAQGQQRNSAAGVRSAYGAFIPSVNVSASANRQVPVQSGRTRVENGQVVTLSPEPWSYNAGYGLSVNLFDGGARFFDLKQAKAQASAAGANLVTQRYSAVLAAQQQFFNVLAARESQAAARAQLELAEQQLKTSVLQLQARTVTRSDSLRAEIQLHNAHLATLQAQNDLELSEASLTRAVGTPYRVTAAPDDSLDRPGLALDDATLAALTARSPAIEEATASLEAARAALRSTWTSYLPSITASYSRNGSGASSDFSLAADGYAYSGAVRLSLSLPVFDQFQRSQQVTQAEVSRDNAQAALRDARLEATESLTRSLGAFHTAEERVATQLTTLQAADEDLRVQKEKYALGTSTLLDVLTSQSTLDQARRDLIQARYDQRVAKAQLEALVGRSL